MNRTQDSFSLYLARGSEDVDVSQFAFRIQITLHTYIMLLHSSPITCLACSVLCTCTRKIRMEIIERPQIHDSSLITMETGCHGFQSRPSNGNEKTTSWHRFFEFRKTTIQVLYVARDKKYTQCRVLSCIIENNHLV